MTVEVTMSVILLITSGLLIRAVWRVQAVDPGFVPQNVLTLRTALPRPKYDSPVRRGQFYERVLTGVRALPGVQSAAFISGLPMVVTGLITGVEIPGHETRDRPKRRREPPLGDAAVFQDRWAFPFTAGVTWRMPTPATGPGSPSSARRSSSVTGPVRIPIGKTFGHRGQTRTVVGVVGDIRVRGLERNSEPQMYLPAPQIPEGNPANFDPKDLVIRHSGQGDALVSAVRQIVRAADPEQPISDVRPLDDVLAGETASRRAQLQVLGVLAVVAVLLSSVGIYGLLAYTVSQRSQEIAVRLALGAEPARVGRMIFADGMRLALLGIVPGVLGAYAAARGMTRVALRRRAERSRDVRRGRRPGASDDVRRFARAGAQGRARGADVRPASGVIGRSLSGIRPAKRLEISTKHQRLNERPGIDEAGSSSVLGAPCGKRGSHAPIQGNVACRDHVRDRRG